MMRRNFAKCMVHVISSDTGTHGHFCRDIPLWQNIKVFLPENNINYQRKCASLSKIEILADTSQHARAGVLDVMPKVVTFNAR